MASEKEQLAAKVSDLTWSINYFQIEECRLFGVESVSKTANSTEVGDAIDNHLTNRKNVTY